LHQSNFIHFFSRKSFHFQGEAGVSAVCVQKHVFWTSFLHPWVFLTLKQRRNTTRLPRQCVLFSHRRTHSHVEAKTWLQCWRVLWTHFQALTN